VWEGKGRERKGKKSYFFLAKKRNNSLNCMDFIIYATYFGILTREPAEKIQKEK